MNHADEYKPLIVGYNNGAGGQASDVADVSEFNAEHSHRGISERQALDHDHHLPPAGRQHHRYRRSRPRELPSIQASIPQGIKTTIVLDRTTTIRASVSDVERTLMLSIILVILVVFIFLRNWRATLIPAVAVPVSLIGTFAVMYLFGFSIDNLSLMALTISTGFVVDDAIVVMENISRLREGGMSPMKAAFKGSGRSASPSFPSACR
jgi:multidrug efflux pump